MKNIGCILVVLLAIGCKEQPVIKFPPGGLKYPEHVSAGEVPLEEVHQ
jgi:hypothetical protein